MPACLPEIQTTDELDPEGNSGKRLEEQLQEHLWFLSLQTETTIDFLNNCSLIMNENYKDTTTRQEYDDGMHANFQNAP